MEKTDLLFQMLEQPDRYSDQEWEEILADEECRELYTLMAQVKGAVMSEELSNSTRPEPVPIRRTVILPFRKIAALFLGIVMLSGFAYAAVRTSFFTEPWSEQPVAEVEVVPLPETEKKLILLPSDSIPAVKGDVTFEDNELEEVLRSICNAYKVEIVFRNEEQKHIRLHFSYNTDDKLKDVVEDMNLLKKFRLELKDNKLTVE